MRVVLALAGDKGECPLCPFIRLRLNFLKRCRMMSSLIEFHAVSG